MSISDGTRVLTVRVVRVFFIRLGGGRQFLFVGMVGLLGSQEKLI